MARSGCVLGDGPDIAELRRRNAEQIVRIFRGSSPADPPPAVLLRADEVIE